LQTWSWISCTRSSTRVSSWS